MDGFVFPMGFFVVTKEDGKIFIGKIDPVTRAVLEIYEVEVEK